MAIDENLPEISFSTVNVRGKNLSVQSIKQPNADNKPVLVFLHEGLGCIELWKDFPQKLSSALGLHALDLPRPMNYLEIEAMEFLPELFSKLDMDKDLIQVDEVLI
jgi:hypothetical protein